MVTKFLFGAITLFQTQSFNSEINTILRDYVKPVLIVLIIIGVAKGIINAIELIADKDDRGTTKEGFIKLGILVGAVALSIIVINFVINKLTGVSLTV